MNARTNGGTERVKLLEKAMDNLGESVRKRDRSVEADLSEIQAELKALKLFLARNLPEFKKQFPGIRGKVR